MIYKVEPTEHKELVSVWESSVKATHHFLRREDFDFYREIVPSFFENVVLHCVKNEELRIVGFMGTHNENLEMLFVTAEYIGKGVGRELLRHAIENLKVTKVDVNEDNLQAVAFYNHFGFQLKSVSESDGFGKPYPILHLELTGNPR